jgi:ketosteroid isomerase-like protein
MKVLSVAVVVVVLTAGAEHAVQKPAAPVGSENPGRDADRAAIEKLKQQDAVLTVARDAVAMADLWTDDAVRFGPDAAAHVGKQAIREANQRSMARIDKVVSFVPETRDLTIWNGGAVEWRAFTASFVASPGGEPTQVRGAVLAVLKKLPDGSWKVFRAMGIPE